MTQSEVEARLTSAVQMKCEADDRLYTTVRRLREMGATWVQMANVLGVTPQAVQGRFGHD